MKLVPAFSGVGDLSYFEVADDLPITDVVGRVREKGLVRMIPPMNEGVYFMSLQSWFPRFNPIVLEAEKSSDYRILEIKRPKVFEKRTISLMHSDGEIRLDDSLKLTTLPEVLQYDRVEKARVDVTYFAYTHTSRENFIFDLKRELPNAGYSLEREEWYDRLTHKSGRTFRSEDCEDYRFKGHIENSNPFELVKFLKEYSPCRLDVGQIELTGFNNRKIGSFNLSR